MNFRNRIKNKKIYLKRLKKVYKGTYFKNLFINITNKN